jgi:hypothetical protein
MEACGQLHSLGYTLNMRMCEPQNQSELCGEERNILLLPVMFLFFDNTPQKFIKSYVHSVVTKTLNMTE